MLKRILQLRHLTGALTLFVIGALFFLAGWAITDSGKEEEINKIHQQALALYEGATSLEGQKRADALTKAAAHFAEIPLLAREENIAAVSFYNSGTVYLEEFLKNEKNTDWLESSILYLQESLRRDPGLERAQRNLELALKKAKKYLMDKMGEVQKNGNAAKNGGEKSDKSESQKGGNEDTKEPLPHKNEGGFGRGQEPKDY